MLNKTNVQDIVALAKQACDAIMVICQKEQFLGSGLSL